VGRVEGARVGATHDPSIAKDGDQYYVFATGAAPGGGQLPIRCSHNLTEWKLCGSVFDSFPEAFHKMSPGTRDLWAPDISFFNGKYHLYYAYSLFGRNLPGIALATNETLNSVSPRYRWQDEGAGVQSAASDDFNAIDPNIVLDEKRQPWLSFGSFWSGIKMRRIDPATGKLAANDSKLYSLAGKLPPNHSAPAKPGFPADWQAIEAPFIVGHQWFYYLFVSFDLCCRGVHSSYRTMVGRSRRVTGPYVDPVGREMLKGGGSELVAANGR